MLTSTSDEHTRQKVKQYNSPLQTDPPRVPMPPVPTGYFRWKGWMDRSLAALFLIPAVPLMGLLIAVIRVTSRGPGVYRQVRVGRNERAYTMYKLRTMLCTAEAATGPVWTQAKDPRVTRLGRILRKLHLDELPQLFNVVRGEMSLIGPRPERPEFVAILAEAIVDYSDRLAVLPGITGLAQINLPPDSDLASVRKKVALDRAYILRANLLLDVRILLATSMRIIGVPGAIAARLMVLHRHKVAVVDSTSDDFATEVESSTAFDMTPDGLRSQACLVPPKSNGNGNGNGNGHAPAIRHRANGTPKPEVEAGRLARPKQPK